MARFNIPAENLYELKYRVGELNKRAEKLGVPPIVLTIGEPEERASEERPGGGATFYAVEVLGERIGLEGWRFLGTIEHGAEANILRAAPGQELAESYRHAAKACDHCGVKRARKDTFVVEHDDGTTKQLGRSCIRDYLGHRNAQAIASWLTEVAELEDSNAQGHRSKRSLEPVEIVALACADVRLRGRYFPAAMTFDSTAGQVRLFLYLKGKKRTDWLASSGFELTAADIAEAEGLIAWIASQGAATGYVANLKAASAMPTVQDKHVGLLASLPVAKRTDDERQAEKAQRDAERAVIAAQEADAQDAPSGRWILRGEVVKLTYQENAYGGTNKMIMRTDDGWKLYVSEPSGLSPTEGDWLELTATVTPSDKDPKFAFGKRPTKATLIAEATRR